MPGRTQLLLDPDPSPCRSRQRSAPKDLKWRACRYKKRGGHIDTHVAKSCWLPTVQCMCQHTYHSVCPQQHRQAGQPCMQPAGTSIYAGWIKLTRRGMRDMSAMQPSWQQAQHTRTIMMPRTPAPDTKNLNLHANAGKRADVWAHRDAIAPHHHTWTLHHVPPLGDIEPAQNDTKLQTPFCAHPFTGVLRMQPHITAATGVHSKDGLWEPNHLRRGQS